MFHGMSKAWSKFPSVGSSSSNMDLDCVINLSKWDLKQLLRTAQEIPNLNPSEAFWGEDSHLGRCFCFASHKIQTKK